MAGDDELDAIYLANGSDALRLAFLLTGNRETAEDIAQEAFVRLGGRILGFRDSGHARAYLFRIIVNLARGRGRKLTLERVALQKVRPSEVAVAPDLGERDQLWSALRSVPKRQRAALFLRYYLDMSLAQAAVSLDCSESALKSLVSRGLASVRAALEGDEQ